jgi:hypothetical protein
MTGRELMTRVRRHLNYATVVSALTAFVVLAGGAAFAANQLAKNSVGKKQLKKNSVTTAKIRNNAVTAAKIRANSVDGAKVAPASLGATDVQLDGSRYTGVVQRLRVPTNTVLAIEAANEVPLPGASYTQEAGRTDTYVGAMDVLFPAGCEVGNAGAYLLMDAPSFGGKIDMTIVNYAVAVGFVEVNGDGVRRVHLGPFSGGTRFAPSAAFPHTFSIVAGGGCKSGGQATVTSVAIDVIGTR